MRILIVSDTHRYHKNLEQVLEQVTPINMMIHLGDVEGCESEIIRMAGCPVEIVAGNNDFFSQQPREKELRLGKYRVLITHGHYYHVGNGTADIRREALARGYDIVMFGHTHMPFLDDSDNRILLNPGSISYPRQEGRCPSYIIMEIDQKGEARFQMEYLMDESP